MCITLLVELLHLAVRYPVQPVISRNPVLVENSLVMLKFSQTNRFVIRPCGWTFGPESVFREIKYLPAFGFILCLIFKYRAAIVPGGTWSEFARGHTRNPGISKI
jgi:hypothetical protein